MPAQLWRSVKNKIKTGDLVKHHIHYHVGVVVEVLADEDISIYFLTHDFLGQSLEGVTESRSSESYVVLVAA